MSVTVTSPTRPDPATLAEQDRTLLQIAAKATRSLGKFNRDTLVKRSGVANLTPQIDRALAAGHLIEVMGDAFHKPALRLTAKGWAAAGVTPPLGLVDDIKGILRG